MTFKWEGAAHNVVMVESKDDYDNCFVPENMREAEEDRGGITFKARQEGTYYFVCGVSTIPTPCNLCNAWRTLINVVFLQVGGHCEFGKQKAQITVSGTCA